MIGGRRFAAGDAEKVEPGKLACKARLYFAEKTAQRIGRRTRAAEDELPRQRRIEHAAGVERLGGIWQREWAGLAEQPGETGLEGFHIRRSGLRRGGRPQQQEQALRARSTLERNFLRARVHVARERQPRARCIAGQRGQRVARAAGSTGSG